MHVGQKFITYPSFTISQRLSMKMAIIHLIINTLMLDFLVIAQLFLITSPLNKDETTAIYNK